MTATEEAARIRAEYARRGWNSRMIGVRAEYYSMGCSIHVTIKSPVVKWREAKRIAEGAERVARCSHTGEILSGGNRYVHFNFSREYEEIIARRHLDALEDAVDKLRELEPGLSVRVHGTPGSTLLFQEHRGDQSATIAYDPLDPSRIAERTWVSLTPQGLVHAAAWLARTCEDDTTQPATA